MPSPSLIPKSIHRYCRFDSTIQVYTYSLLLTPSSVTNWGGGVFSGDYCSTKSDSRLDEVDQLPGDVPREAYKLVSLDNALGDA